MQKLVRLLEDRTFVHCRVLYFILRAVNCTCEFHTVGVSTKNAKEERRRREAALQIGSQGAPLDFVEPEDVLGGAVGSRT